MRSNLRSKQPALKLKLSNLISKVFYPDGFIRRDFLLCAMMIENYGLANYRSGNKVKQKKIFSPEYKSLVNLFKGCGFGQSP